jgi:hypothetical protein
MNETNKPREIASLDFTNDHCAVCFVDGAQALGINPATAICDFGYKLSEAYTMLAKFWRNQGL